MEQDGQSLPGRIRDGILVPFQAEELRCPIRFRGASRSIAPSHMNHDIRESRFSARPWPYFRVRDGCVRLVPSFQFELLGISHYVPVSSWIQTFSPGNPLLIQGAQNQRQPQKRHAAQKTLAMPCNGRNRHARRRLLSARQRNCLAPPARRELHIGGERDELEEKRQELGGHGHQPEGESIAHDGIPIGIPRIRGELE